MNRQITAKSKCRQTFRFILLLGMTLLLCPACEEKETTVLTVEPAQLSLGGEATSRLIKIMSNADWTIDLGDAAAWIHTDLSSGEGDGSTHLIDVGIDSNTEALRTGTITVRAGSEVRTVVVNQHSVTFGTPELSRPMTVGFPLDGSTLNIPYVGFRGGETFKISVQMEGGSAGGIDNVTGFDVTLPNTEGVIAIPLSGTPTTAGTITLVISTDNPGYSIAPIFAKIHKLTFGKARLSGYLKKGKDVSGRSIIVPYSNASGRETFTVSISTTGAGAAGIAPVTGHPVAISGASGTFDIPLSGTPETNGSLTFSFELSVHGITIEQLDASVYNKVYLDMDFNLMLLGGDRIGQREGKIVDTAITPWDITTDPGKVNLPANAVYKSCPASTLGTSFFGTGAGTTSGDGTISNSYKTLRGLIGAWTGNRIFEQPGYVAFGTSGGDGYLVTPPLSEIVGTADIQVLFRAARTDEAAVKVTVQGGGTILGGIDTFPLSALRVWEQKSFTVIGATPNTIIRFANSELVAGKRNFCIDDLLIVELN
jgi:hypothetical protein